MSLCESRDVIFIFMLLFVKGNWRAEGVKTKSRDVIVFILVSLCESRDVIFIFMLLFLKEYLFALPGTL